AAAVTYGGAPMNVAMRVVHPDPTYQPAIEMWQLADPPTGAVTVSVVLDGMARSLEVGVVIVDGVNSAQPIRNFGAGTGGGFTTSGTVNSGDGDVVIDAVCAGNSIDAQAPGATPLINEDRGNVSTCGNFEIGRQPGASPNLTSHWTV